MITLINDFLGYKELLKEHSGASRLNFSYLDEHKAAFKEQYSALLKTPESYVADGAYLQAARHLELAARDVLELFNDACYEHKFSGFNVAIYQGFYNESLYDLAHKLDAKIVRFETERFENGFRYLEFNKPAAFKQASKILLDAYDNGADFMLVNDLSSMQIFDGAASELSAISNRDFGDFYILSAAEMIALALGKTPNSLKSHKLKVNLI